MCGSAAAASRRAGAIADTVVVNYFLALGRFGLLADLLGGTVCVPRSVYDAVRHGYRRVKIKVMPGWDVAAVDAAREAIAGEEIPLTVDANGAYEWPTHEREHPTPRPDEDGQKRAVSWSVDDARTQDQPAKAGRRRDGLLAFELAPAVGGHRR